MASVDVLNWNKEKVGTVELSDDVFDVEARRDILHAVVKWQLAGRRKGNHQAKTRAMVRGGGKKPFKQKGTGRARQGSSRSPLLEGGGVIFPPRPRDYSYKMLKKLKRRGLSCALSYLMSQGRVFVMEKMTSSEGKTKELSRRLKSFDVEQAFLVDDRIDSLFQRAARNLPKVRYNNPDGVNVYDLLKYNCLMITPAAATAVEARCGRK